MSAIHMFYNANAKKSMSDSLFLESLAVSPPSTQVVSSSTAGSYINTMGALETPNVSDNTHCSLSLSHNYVKNIQTSPLESSCNYLTEPTKEQEKHKHTCHYNFCGWSFKRYEHLKRHMLVHTGERPHQCHYPSCGKRFSRSDNFHAHYRTHTKTKDCTTMKTKKKSAAVTTVSAAVTSGVTNTLNDSSGQYIFLTNQLDRNFMTSNKNAASSIATTAAVVAVQQQQIQQKQHVFHNDSHLYDSDPSNFKKNDGAMYNYETNTFTMTSPPTPICNQFGEVITKPDTTVPSQFNLSLPNSHITTSYHNNFFSYMEPLFPPSSAYNNHLISSSSATYTPNHISDNLEFFFHQHPKSKIVSTKESSFNTIRSTEQSTKSHKCPILECSRKFKRLEHLKRHMRIHTLEKPFKCSYHSCEKRFSRSDNLSQHIKTHRKHVKQ